MLREVDVSSTLYSMLPQLTAQAAIRSKTVRFSTCNATTLLLGFKDDFLQNVLLIRETTLLSVA